ncbi:DUF512 domain-containing protein [Dethiobacter alkaliphilus]|uniref:DUF512 domain-containing protein n=1 Tax=Dethiobacter alkaliphilus TaxID=427926 RepID=UPI0022271BB5|nr:DUF512 domain-containing protein [Dethiobacter alkaliphilus]MCW3490536.1 DUF512 domain-containing protein [Dethiobacter alkaliphilus]
MKKTTDRPDRYPYLLTAVSQDNVLPLTSVCNLGCIFCSHRQNPPEVTTFRLPPLSMDQILELAQFLDPNQKVIIGESATRLDEGEPFTHPQIITVLEKLRSLLPDTVFALTTNGTLLTTQTIGKLKALAPLEITLSLNSVTPAGRQLLLRDKDPARAAEAVRSLKLAGVPFHGSLLAMPHLTGWPDMEETVDFLAAENARTVRVFLPGYTARAPQNLRFPLSLWPEIITWAKKKTEQLGVPVIPEPACPANLLPQIYGIMPASPAAGAGLQSGDIIRAVDAKTVRTRVEAYQAARQAANPRLKVERNGNTFTASLTKERGQAPGFVIHYDFATGRMDEVAAEIRRHRAKAPLLLASEFAGPLLKEVASLLSLPANSVRVVNNSFFGGSIRAAGLLTAQDFLAAAREVMAQQHCDLLLLPREAFDHRGVDLCGEDISTLTAALNIPVCAV